MVEPRVTAVSIEQQPARTAAVGMVKAATAVFSRVGLWAIDTAQQFGMLTAILMGPAVFATYAFAAWALASNLGWTDTFIFTSGALSNWLIWLGAAVLVNTASAILKKRTQAD